MPRFLCFGVAFIVLAAPAAAATHADLAIDVSSPPRLQAARLLGLYGTIRNLGPDTAENVTVVATTSSGATVDVSLTCGAENSGRCDALAPGAEGRISFTIHHDGSEGELKLDVRATTSTHDVDSTNDNVSRTILVTSAPVLHFSLSAPIADPGGLAEYQAWITNQGVLDATNVSFDLPLPDGWSLGESLTPRLTCAPSSAGARCTLSRVSTGERVIERFTLRAPDVKEGLKWTATQVTLTSDKGVFDRQPATAFFVRRIYRHLLVTNTEDEGEGSLRQAIVDANGSCPPDGVACKIVFDIAADPPQRVYSIQPLTPLPKIVGQGVIIDGATQRARHGDSNPEGPEIEINGSKLTVGNGIEARSSAFQILDIIINGFPFNGLSIESGFNVVRGCYIGTDAAGRHAIPNGQRGVVINAMTEVRDNVISGNARSGIFVTGGSSISITGNRIGAAAGPGLAPLGNGASGIYFGPRVRGNAAARNIIAFNKDAGISIDAAAGANTLSANSITSNGSLGIDYGLDGPSLKGAPLLTSARYDDTQRKTIIEGHIEISTVYPFVEAVEIFANRAADASGNVEAELFLGRVLLTSKDFHFEYDADLRGFLITATLTSHGPYYPELQDLRTSELSQAVRVEGDPSVPVDERFVAPHGADVGVHALSAYPAIVTAGGRSTAYFLVTNLGPGDAEQVAVSFRAEEATFLADSSGHSCQSAPGQVLCTLPRLAAGSNENFSIQVVAPLDRDRLDIVATVSSTTEDLVSQNNEFRSSIRISKAPALDLYVASTFPVEPGATALYRVRVEHESRLDARDVVIQVPLPSAWSFVGSTGDWQCGVEGSRLLCRLPRLEAGSDSSFTFTLRAPPSDFGQRRSSDRVSITTADGIFYDSNAYIITEVYRQTIVTTAADAGAGSLREAITRANAECSADGVDCKIIFALPPPVPPEGYYSIRLRSPLPPILGAITIDARTQTERRGGTNPFGPGVELNGSALAAGNGIEIRSGLQSGVRGLVINGFPENGIVVSEGFTGFYLTRRTVADCYIGTDATGSKAIPNRLRGIFVQGQAPPSVRSNLDIVGNVVSGNGRSGIFLQSGSDFRILSNRIGAAAGDALLPLGNGASGIYLGAVAAVQVDQNVIAFNADMGVAIDRQAAAVGVRRDVLIGNRQLAIDYGLDSVTRNDAPNRRQDLPEFPLLLSAVWEEANGVTRIEGIAPRSGPFLSDRGIVDLYRDAAADPSGFGPAEEWLGEVFLEHSDEPQRFSFTIPRDLRGSFISATFTRAAQQMRWTSELCQTIPVAK